LLETILRGKQLGYTLAEINRLIQPSHDQTTVTDLESNLSSEQMLSQIGILEKRRDDLDRAISALHRAQESRAAFANA
jgi:DNA-binding transcriptional MerR regulator